MEEMLAGFATYGEAPGDIGARSQSTLHGIADGHVFILHFFADGDAFTMMLGGGGADVREVIIKNDGALVHAER